MVKYKFLFTSLLIVFALSVISATPSYNMNTINNTNAGVITLFSINVTDDVALHPDGQYVFSTNNTGAWTNDTLINFTATPSWSNVTKILNSTEDFIVGYMWYFNDSAGNVNTTPIYTLTTDDLTPPTYSLPSVNNTFAGHLAFFTLLVNDNIRLNNNGMHIFSTNSTGLWVNNSGVNFVVTPSSTETTYTLNSTKDTIIGYMWYINDSAGNINSTPIYTLTTVEYLLSSGFSSTYDSPMGTVKNVTCYYVSSDLECLSKNLLYDCDSNYYTTEEMCLAELDKINQQPALIRDLRLNALYFGGKFLPSNPFLGFLLLLLIIYGVVKVFIIGKGKLGLKNQKRKVFK